MSREISTEIPRDRDCAGRARQFVAQALGDLLTREQRDNALLVSSELVTNAYQHGQGRIELTLRIDRREVTISVTDQGRGEGVRVRPLDDRGGWGLRIVDGLARDWGVFEGTAHVWATLPAG